MYKVMIIDDEPIIVQGLARMVPWNKWGCYVVDTAGDGEEGLRKIEEHHPDMIFMDICMPRMDGLSMVAALKSQYRDAQIAILTGFRDFEYAKQALNLGVTRFLLKPSNMKEIEEAVTVMAERLKERRAFAGMDAGAPEGQALGTGQESPESESAEPEAANSFIVRNAVAYVEAHYREKLLLSDVAKNTYVSQWHLSKLLNRELSQNFSELLNSIRIDKAKELLEDPSLRIGDIAEEVGFLDLAHFSRVFKRMTGMSANEYRNKQ